MLSSLRAERGLVAWLPDNIYGNTNLADFLQQIYR